jgi:hypothetical protein
MPPHWPHCATVPVEVEAGADEDEEEVGLTVDDAVDETGEEEPV